MGVVGQVVRDTIVTPAATVNRLGGTPVYAARALRAAGAEPVLVVRGPAIDGATVLAGEQATACTIEHRDGVTLQTVTAVGDPFTAAEAARTIVPALRGCAWVLLGGQTAGDFPPEMIAVLAAAGLSVCIDAQGLARGAHPGPVRLRPFPVGAVAGATAVKLNRAEADAQRAPEGDLRRTLDVPELLVSDGPLGASVETAQWRDSAPAGARRFTDPTGAGDALTALYLLARTAGRSPRESLTSAVAGVDRLHQR